MQVVRKYLLLLFTASTAGLLIELCLLGHYEDAWQLVPLILLLVAFILGSLELFLRRERSSKPFKYFNYVLLISAGIGMYLHYHGNREFELEMYPDLAGWALFTKVMTGATPALSPGALMVLAILGWISTQAGKQVV